MVVFFSQVLNTIGFEEEEKVPPAPYCMSKRSFFSPALNPMSFCLYKPILFFDAVIFPLPSALPTNTSHGFLKDLYA